MTNIKHGTFDLFNLNRESLILFGDGHHGPLDGEQGRIKPNGPSIFSITLGISTNLRRLEDDVQFQRDLEREYGPVNNLKSIYKREDNIVLLSVPLIEGLKNEGIELDLGSITQNTFPDNVYNCLRRVGYPIEVEGRKGIER